MNRYFKRYFKRYWDEPPNGQRSSWGGATYYFEVDESLFPLRQVEVYDGGVILRYGPEHATDSHGMLSDQQLDIAESAAYEIQPEEFESIWNSGARDMGLGSEGRRI